MTTQNTVCDNCNEVRPIHPLSDETFGMDMCVECMLGWHMERSDCEHGDDEGCLFNAMEDLQVQYAHEHTSGMHDTAAMSSCPLCDEGSYAKREVWSVGLTYDVLIGTYDTQTDQQARECALLTIARDGIRYVAALDVRRAFPEAADLPRIMHAKNDAPLRVCVNTPDVIGFEVRR